MNRWKKYFKASKMCAYTLLFIALLTSVSFSQSNGSNSSAKGKPSPSPSASPTPIPPVDTKCYVGSGCIDAAFGVNGLRMLPGETMEATALQSDGKIVTAGSGPGIGGPADAVIVRMNPNGTLDNTFGDVDLQDPLVRLGYRYDDVDGLSNRARALAIQPDGRIVIGMTRVEQGVVQWTIVRLESNGDRDITFGNGGVVRLNYWNSGIGLVINGIAVQSNGRIVASGGDWVARFNYDGSPDTTFGTNGVVNNLAPIMSSSSIAIQVIQGQDRIVLGGYQTYTTGKGRTTQHNEYSVVRLLPSGQLDTSFGTGGKANAYFGFSDLLQGLAIDANNRIVAGGIVGTAGNQAAGIVRFTESGALDLTFGSGTGKVSTLVNGYRTTSQDIILQPDGKIVSIGFSESASAQNNLTLIRYNSDGSLDNSFGPGMLGSGIVTADFSGGSTEYGQTGVILQDGGIAAGGYTNAHSFFTRYIP